MTLLLYTKPHALTIDTHPSLKILKMVTPKPASEFLSEEGIINVSRWDGSFGIGSEMS